MRGPILTLTLTLLAALPAWGQSMVTPEAALDAFEGRTITLVDPGSGRVIGVERFLGRDRSIYAEPDGTCVYGAVTVQGPRLCFRYDGPLAAAGNQCWWVFEMDGTLHVRSAGPGGSIQRVDGIGDAPIDCRPPPNV